MKQFLPRSRSSRAMARCALVLVATLSANPAAATADLIVQTEKVPVRIETMVKGLEHPWGMAFLPDGRILVTERPGRLRLIGRQGLEPKPIEGVPEVTAHGQGGLLDVVLDPQFADNQYVYLSYTAQGDDGIGTEVARGRFDGKRLQNVEEIFRATPRGHGGRHFGSRLVFDRQGRLYITLGDRGERPRAQRLDDHAGSVIRIEADGQVPEDNPFVGRSDARAEIFSFGNRNVQGAALHPHTGELWAHEHGPQGGDELNIIRPGVNYGWPVITFGVNYGIGTSIGEGTRKEGMAQPLYYWVPSIAPSGMTFYTADRFPEWRGNIFVGSLKFRQLVRLDMDGERVVHEERMLEDAFGRVRDVRQGPDGYLYLLTDESNGELLRLMPAR